MDETAAATGPRIKVGGMGAEGDPPRPPLKGPQPPMLAEPAAPGERVPPEPPVPRVAAGELAALEARLLARLDSLELALTRRIEAAATAPPPKTLREQLASAQPTRRHNLLEEREWSLINWDKGRR